MESLKGGLRSMTWSWRRR